MYTCGGRITGEYVEWFQTRFGSLMALFKRVGLKINGTKTKSMVYTSVIYGVGKI